MYIYTEVVPFAASSPVALNVYGEIVCVAVGEFYGFSFVLLDSVGRSGFGNIRDAYINTEKYLQTMGFHVNWSGFVEITDGIEIIRLSSKRGWHFAVND